MVYHVSSWTDSSLFPDLVSSSLTRDWFLNISLEARPEDDGFTEDDFNKVLEIFSRRQRVRPNSDEMRVLTSIPGKYDFLYIYKFASNQMTFREP